ncbi:tRNA (5-methylaminomethyl-2-thiouridine)(34)-methyltransferase MnmD [Pseudosulfitobacter koreensis]|uniref:tRNA (5-methylaminomethyl-2-thiouridine)(34)-methyltransferase MnmD n=1 Tax=Pseudosulfitobacter koreensis TaxID=2968472 RepID=A0ABT1YW30_9RHOB|nr:tRNA (5-methylaminomethyl-2-thiouridine)(34)-methyltransferase MnmD [Pseudosulfitobacter koreense]MCR8825099.1 tRNA (5-methylaminomethyl-2-thiouridine)(34)-methyltransferase MnmD [Pseudosulfitobacter koreense]
MQDQRADLEWRDGDVPVSTRFDDPYFSLENGLDETRHVFLTGNGLPERFCDGFHVGELGFGTGLNFVVTLAAWRASGVSGVLHFTSFEAYPMSVDEMARALGAFGVGDDLVAVWNGRGGRFDFGDAVLDVIAGDARETLPAWQGAADAWYLDGFSPAKNPELWDEQLMQAVADHTHTLGTFATYTAAGFVRRGLEAAGFDVRRISGYGRKRHMTVGTRR